MLEKTAKDQKAAFQNKMKVLIDKTENDDKLITMLKAEIKKLETSKGIKSSLTVGGRKAAVSQAGGIDPEEHVKLQARCSMLSNNVKCLEIDLERKEEKIQSLLTNCIGAPDERLEENEALIGEL